MTSQLLVVVVAQLLMGFLMPAICAMLTWNMSERGRAWFVAGGSYCVFIAMRRFGISEQNEAFTIFAYFTLWTYIALIVFILLLECNIKSNKKYFIGAVITLSIGNGLIEHIYDPDFNNFVTNILTFLLSFIILFLSFKASILNNSKSMYIIAVSALLSVFVRIVVIYGFLNQNTIFQFGLINIKTEFLLASQSIILLCLNIGYFGFIIERFYFQSALALKDKIEAETSHHLIRKALEDRNRMLLLNSQFATVSAAALFSAGLIHELAQPVQTLKLAFHRLFGDPKNPDQQDADRQLFGAQIDQVSRIIRTFQSLLSNGQASVEKVNVAAILRDALPIIQSECECQNIKFISEIPPEPVEFLGNPVLLQRVIFNIAQNAIVELKKLQDPAKTLLIKLRVEDHNFALIIQNTGSEIPKIKGFKAQSYAGSGKDGGIGIGLLLCIKIAEFWNGSLDALPVKYDGKSACAIVLDLPRMDYSRIGNG